MSKNFNNRTLAVSHKVYGWLLRAYPPAHREKYGPAMAQLFRDQCRDAWNESQGWSVARLWLRVLPDLVKTSMIERLAVLTERKSMTDKINSLVQPRTVFLKVFVVVFLLILCATTTLTFLLPDTYASTARIKVEPEETAATTGTSQNFDPYFIQTTFEVFQTEAVLDPVIDKLDLNVLWGKKYNAGKILTTAESLDILKARVTLAPVRNTKLVSITVYSEDPREAADIANAIAESYQNYRIQSQHELTAKKIGTLPPGQEKQAAQLQAHVPKTVLVTITDPAIPGHSPVRPNKTLNIILGVFGGIILASVVGGIAAFIALRFSKRNGGTVKPA